MKHPGCHFNSAQLLTGAELDLVCAQVEAYYAAKLVRYGATPLGVDWSCMATQWLRFVQLLRICPSDNPFSLIDLGCGYGALASFLGEHRRLDNVEYLGIDLSSEMVRRGRRRHRGNSKVRFVVGRNVLQPADYVVASGIMNVMLGFSLLTWERFVRTTLSDMHRMSKLGFAVNFVTKPTGVEFEATVLHETREMGPNSANKNLASRPKYRQLWVAGVHALSPRFKPRVRRTAQNGTFGGENFRSGLINDAKACSHGRSEIGRSSRPGRGVRLPIRRSRLHKAALFVISPDGHMDEPGLQTAFTLLRAEAPVYWVDCPGMRPFWLVTRHADVTAVEAKGAPFIATPRSVLSSEAGEANMQQISGKPDVLRSLFQMDDPEHRVYRNISRAWFSQLGIRNLEGLVECCARHAVERIPQRGEVFDFALEVAVPFPLRIMMHILGLPQADDLLILKLARGLTGGEDPDRALSDRPADPYGWLA